MTLVVQCVVQVWVSSKIGWPGEGIELRLNSGDGRLGVMMWKLVNR